MNPTKIGMMLAAALLLTVSTTNAITLPIAGTWVPPVPSAYAYCDLNSAASGAYSPSGFTAQAQGAIFGTGWATYSGSAATTYSGSVSAFPLGVSEATASTVGASAACAVYGYFCSGVCPPPPMPSTAKLTALTKTKFQVISILNPVQPTVTYKGALYQSAATAGAWFIGTKTIGSSTQAFTMGPNADNALVFDNGDLLALSQAAPQDARLVSNDPFQVTFAYDSATQTTVGNLSLTEEGAQP